MTFEFSITNLLICVGALIMAFNVKKFQDVTRILKKMSLTQYAILKPNLIFHHILIVLFFIGYLVVLIAINSNALSSGNFFVSLIFASGAVFVLLSIRVQRKMIAAMEKARNEILAANNQLFSKQKRLTETNQALKQEIENGKITEVNLERSYATQTVVNEILKKSLTESAIMEVMNHSLDLLLSLSWLSFESQGCIFLTDEKTGNLFLAVHRGLAPELEEKCRRVPFGKCLCGRAAKEQKIVYAAHIDDRHDILFPGIEDHGHYCIPILGKNQTLGVVNLYLKPGHQRNDWEIDFLNSIANTLAMVIMQYQAEQQKNQMAQQLHQTRKMESIGTLAGGIAHDFNNILSGIFGYTHLALRSVNEPEKVKEKLEQINKGAKRATDLIQQILTFSRKAEYKKTPVALNAIVMEVIEFLRSSIPSSIRIVDQTVSQGLVLAESTKIHQIVMNLCTNAFHAMKETGGELFIQVEDVTLDRRDLSADLSLKPGAYVKLTVRDTGPGMDKETLSKIFEPYFTTKTVKEGTGLGLSVVLGIVQEHKGHIQTLSTPGKGTCFLLYFPRYLKQNTEKEKKQAALDIMGGSERVLFVDDEQSILNSTSELLLDFGYQVEVYSNPVKALEAFKDNPGRFDLVVTDMTMQEMTGRELSCNLLTIAPDLPIILCTGYSDAICEKTAMKMGIQSYLQKPVDGMELLSLIRSLLDRE